MHQCILSTNQQDWPVSSCYGSTALGGHTSRCIGEEGQHIENTWTLKHEVCGQNQNFSFLLGNYLRILRWCPKAGLCFKDILPGHFKGENIQISIFSDTTRYNVQSMTSRSPYLFVLRFYLLYLLILDSAALNVICIETQTFSLQYTFACCYFLVFF